MGRKFDKGLSDFGPRVRARIRGFQAFQLQSESAAVEEKRRSNTQNRNAGLLIFRYNQRLSPFLVFFDPTKFPLKIEANLSLIQKDEFRSTVQKRSVKLAILKPPFNNVFLRKLLLRVLRHEAYLLIYIIGLFEQPGYSICTYLMLVNFTFIRLQMLVYEFGHLRCSDQTVLC